MAWACSAPPAPRRPRIGPFWSTLSAPRPASTRRLASGTSSSRCASLPIWSATIAGQVRAADLDDAVGRVRVLNAEAARLTRPRHLFVGGLSEQSFPAVHRSAAPAGSTADDAAAAARAAEMLLFYQLVTRPTETLTLSYPALDERAQTLPASPFLVELERAFGADVVPRTVQPLNYGRYDGAVDEPPLARSELRRQAVARALERDRGPLASLAAARPVGDAILAGIESVADRARRDEFGRFEGLLASAPAAAKLGDAFGAGHPWSPSQLETYADCPFLFFGKQLLRLRPSPEMVLASDAARRGSVLHETLARVVRRPAGAEPRSRRTRGAAGGPVSRRRSRR